jgi:hypothetical protein
MCGAGLIRRRIGIAELFKYFTQFMIPENGGLQSVE